MATRRYPHIIVVMVYREGMSSLVLHHEPAGTLATATLDTWQSVAGAWLLTFPSVNTQAAYRRDLGQYAAFLTELGLTDPLAAPRPAVDAYARHLEDLGLKPASRARKLAAVSSFLRYAAEEGVVDRNPAAHVRRPHVSAESPRLGMNATEARRVVVAAEAASPAHRALVALCLGAGLRVSEALALRPNDLTEEAGHRVARVSGKGGRERVVPLSPSAWSLLLPALEQSTSATEPIIRGPQGGTIDRHRALRMIEALGRAAGLGHALRPHDCRHTAATLALNAGAPIHRVQDLLGHASPQTTQRYVAHRERLENSAAYTLGAVLGGAVA